jgi:hypothetical protein
MMEAAESYERVWESLTRAASCCRELAILTKADEWRQMSQQIIIMRDKAREIYSGAPLTEVQVMNLVAQMEEAQLSAHVARQMGD